MTAVFEEFEHSMVEMCRPKMNSYSTGRDMDLHTMHEMKVEGWVVVGLPVLKAMSMYRLFRDLFVKRVSVLVRWKGISQVRDSHRLRLKPPIP